MFLGSRGRVTFWRLEDRRLALPQTGQVGSSGLWSFSIAWLNGSKPASGLFNFVSFRVFPLPGHVSGAFRGHLPPRRGHWQVPYLRHGRAHPGCAIQNSECTSSASSRQPGVIDLTVRQQNLQMLSVSDFRVYSRSGALRKSFCSDTDTSASSGAERPIVDFGNGAGEDNVIVRCHVT
jgi:hypothetical protein